MREQLAAAAAEALDTLPERVVFSQGRVFAAHDAGNVITSYSIHYTKLYDLVHAPDMLVHNGTTQTSERILNAESDYLKQLSEHIRSYRQAVEYLV